MTTGMLIDGIAASEAIDSSGEILVVDGVDVSSLEAGDGVLNWEHRNEDSPGASPSDVVGKIVYVRKILKKDDCENDRQRKYWDEVKLPLVYIIGRLYDGAGHQGAKDLAAQIRDHYANSEPINVRFSIEGSTLSKDGNRLTHTVARRVACTIKPCNKSAISGLVEDPHAPEGFDKDPAKKDGDKPKDVLAAILAEKHEHPMYQRLGGHESASSPLLEDDHRILFKAILKKKLIEHLLEKATVAGSYGGAPGSLTGGAALQREDAGLRRHHLKNQALAALRDYDGTTFDKGEFRAFLKHKLPEADDSFIDHFVDLAGDYRLKKAEYASLAKAREKTEGLKAPRPSEVAPPPTQFISEQPGLTYESEPDPPNDTKAVPAAQHNAMSLSAKGTLKLKADGGRQRQLHIYTPTDWQYNAVLRPDHEPLLTPEQKALYKENVHGRWTRAMNNWLVLNHALENKKLPRKIVKLAAVFSAMSPNTGVPLQERHYGHFMDMVKNGSIDLDEPITEDHIREFDKRARGAELPEWEREHWKLVGPRQTDAYARNPNAIGTKKEMPQIAPLRSVNDLSAYLEDLGARYGSDGRKIVSELMNMKATKEGGADRSYPAFKGFSSKLARYAAAMMGAGNVFVPDRHMVRSLFDIHKDNPRGALLQGVLSDPTNNHFLEALDHHFAGQPAHQHVLTQYPDYFHGREDQALFPAFWLHWLSIPHYEQLRQRPTLAENAGTDHMVFWKSIQDIMRTHGIPIVGEGQPKGNDLDFLTKNEGHPLSATSRAMLALADVHAKHGELPALFAFFAHIAPMLVAAESRPKPAEMIRKFERIAIDLRKAVDDTKAQLPKVMQFGGEHVRPGTAVVPHTGQQYAVLGSDHNGCYLAVPSEHAANWKPQHLVRLPIKHEGKKYNLVSPPEKVVSTPIVDSTVHGVPQFTRTPEQHQLLHGIDVSNWHAEEPMHAAKGHGKWVRGGDGSLAYAKTREVMHEGLYHDMARDVFGLGHYLPTTALFTHPQTGVIHSIQRAVPDARHGSDTPSTHAIMTGLAQSGELDKLAIMNTVMGQWDRHRFNYVVTPKAKPGIQLIDNGGIFFEGEPDPPDYLGQGGLGRHQPLHPAAAQWALTIDPAKLVQAMHERNVAPTRIRQTAKRLAVIQGGLRKFGSKLLRRHVLSVGKVAV